MDGPLVAIELDRGRPIVAQLVAALRRGILTGALRTGDPMPSTRALAGELGIARSSVVSAYEQLAGEGYLRLRQGAPTTVEALETDAPGPVRGGGAVEPRRADRRAPRPTLGRTARIDLTPGRPSVARLDERAWRAAWRHAASVEVPPDSPPPFGLPALRAALADHLRQARGVTCTADDVVVTAGTGEAIALLALALRRKLGRAPVVAVEDPGYPSARRTLEDHGARSVPVGVAPAGDGIEVDRLHALDPVDAIVVTPSHQYPLGGRLPVAARLALLEWARERDVLVIEDDYDSEFRHTGVPLPALASLDGTGDALGRQVVLVGSFSKVLTSWLRLGQVVLPDEPALRAALLAVREDQNTPVAGPVQLAATALLESGALRRHIAATRRDYAHRRRLVIARLGDLPTPLHGLDGGLHAVLELPDEAASTRLVERLSRLGISTAALSAYGVTAPPTRHGIVIGYAGTTDAQLAEGLAAIRAETLRILDTRGEGPIG